MDEQKKRAYYMIPKAVFWISITVVVVLVTAMSIKIIDLQDMNTVKVEESAAETFHMEYGNIESMLENEEECYLCGNSNRSMMGYYRKFDTVGIIGLNEWYVLDLRLKEYDGSGNPIEASSGTSDSFGNTSE